MTARLLRNPSFVIQCDHREGDVQCTTRYGTDKAWSKQQARVDASREGWSVRPGHGKGMRTAPDLCPAHTGATL